jgi:hypothetical protein
MGPISTENMRSDMKGLSGRFHAAMAAEGLRRLSCDSGKAQAPLVARAYRQ